MNVVLRLLPVLLCVFAGAVPARAQERARDLIDAAWEKMGKRDHTGAIEILDRCVAGHPEQPVAWWMRAYARGQLGDHEAAIRDATRAIELAPDFGRAYGERAYNHGCRQEWELAVVDYERGTALDPDQKNLHGEYGDALFQLGRYLAAIDAYTRALELDPSWVEAHRGRGNAERALTDFRRARRDYVRATELRPDSVDIWRDRAGAEFDCGDDEAALRSAKNYARASVEEFAPVLHGRLAWRIGAFEEALEILAGAAESAEDGVAANALLSTGCIHVARGEDEEAAAALQRARERAIPGLAFWILGMRWCAESGTLGADEAGQRFAAACRDDRLELGDVERAVLAICTGQGDDDGTDPRFVGEGAEGCPRLFFAGWSAWRRGEPETAERLLLRCVNTGAKDWQQWATAVTWLQRRLGEEGVQVAVGAEFDVEDDDDGVRLVVRDVVLGGAAHQQGLKVGDAIHSWCRVPLDLEAWREVVAGAREGLDLRIGLRRGDEESEMIFRTGLALTPVARRHR